MDFIDHSKFVWKGLELGDNLWDLLLPNSYNAYKMITWNFSYYIQQIVFYMYANSEQFRLCPKLAKLEKAR